LVKDFNARFELAEKKPLRWRAALTTAVIGAVALPLSLIHGGPCGPGTIPGMIAMLIGLICLPLGIVMCAIRGLAALKMSLQQDSK
jgi:hypothetical protein